MSSAYSGEQFIPYTGPCDRKVDPCCARQFCNPPSPTRRNELPEKLIFVVEWFDREADLVKKYLLTYYTDDGTIDVMDMIHKRRFMKRLKMPNIHLHDLYIGNVLCIWARQMTIVQYADSCTFQTMEPMTQRAFLLVRPEAVKCIGSVIRELEKHFRVLRARMVQMTENDAACFYEDCSREPFFRELIAQISSGPVVALLLVGGCAIEKLQSLVGEKDPGEAKLRHPMSFRALYGHDKLRNGFEVSESPGCVIKDAAFFFTEDRPHLRTIIKGPSVIPGSTCCIIKPHAVREGLTGHILYDIGHAGFTITALELFYLDRTHAEEFFEIYKGVLPEYAEMTQELADGPCYVLQISDCGRNVHQDFREFVGPLDPPIAKKLRPSTLRAKYGTDRVRNAVHCTDLCEDSELELDYFLRILQANVGC